MPSINHLVPLNEQDNWKAVTEKTKMRKHAKTLHARLEKSFRARSSHFERTKGCSRWVLEMGARQRGVQIIHNISKTSVPKMDISVDMVIQEQHFVLLPARHRVATANAQWHPRHVRAVISNARKLQKDMTFIDSRLMLLLLPKIIRII